MLDRSKYWFALSSLSLTLSCNTQDPANSTTAAATEPGSSSAVNDQTTDAATPEPDTSGATGNSAEGTESTGEGQADSTGPGVPDLVPKSLVIALDGLRGDGIPMSNTPNIDALLDGTWAPGYQGAAAWDAWCLTDAVTDSAPNHHAIMTGATATQSGVEGNQDYPNGDLENFPHYLTVMEAIDPSYNTAKLFTYPRDREIDAFPDYKLDFTDEGNADNMAAIVAQTYEDHRETDEGGDDHNMGTSWDLGTDPDALFLFFDEIDAVGHGAGWSTEAYFDAVSVVDEQLGRVFTAIRERPTFDEESWLIIITSDHGGLNNGHGPQDIDRLTIPFVVVGRSVNPGALPSGGERLPEPPPGATRNLDTVPTVFDHHGIPIPPELTGVSRLLGAE